MKLKSCFRFAENGRIRSALYNFSNNFIVICTVLAFHNSVHYGKYPSRKELVNLFRYEGNAVQADKHYTVKRRQSSDSSFLAFGKSSTLGLPRRQQGGGGGLCQVKTCFLGVPEDLVFDCIKM